jgi:hypothetical protein
MGDDVKIDFDELSKETEAAYLIVINNEKIWIPKSQVRVYQKAKTAYVPEWLALEKGLI